ncbi:chemotaxis protein [Zoogloea sp.]|uniref:chemotaxis protein n=1 Tax=Zoogloea sp. TaxID=49181 RepID=UPI0026245FFD|nr:chemotaxis protein [Zoogloea sp.]
MNAPERNLKPPPRRSGELAGIVLVNEEIKAIVATAFRINLMALNAIFLAKRAGNAALGFGVLSNELRRFAQDLTRRMSSLRDMTSGSVGSVTGVVQQQRNTAILTEAFRLSGEGVPGVREARKRGALRLAEQQASLRALDLRLRAAVEETQQLVELGGVLARSAKIEAAYGGGFSPALMQVSTDFAEVIAQIKRSLEVLGKERLVKD